MNSLKYKYYNSYDEFDKTPFHSSHTALKVIACQPGCEQSTGMIEYQWKPWDDNAKNTFYAFINNSLAKCWPDCWEKYSFVAQIGSSVRIHLKVNQFKINMGYHGFE